MLIVSAAVRALLKKLNSCPGCHMLSKHPLSRVLAAGVYGSFHAHSEMNEIKQDQPNKFAP